MGASAGGAWHHAAQIVRGNLIPQWQDEPDEETHAVCPWWWVENLGADSPPQMLRSYRPLNINPKGSAFFVSLNEPRRWDMRTVAGWIPLVGRVCPIGARPKP